MGALIFLLVITTRQIREQAVQDRLELSQPDPPPVVSSETDVPGPILMTVDSLPTPELPGLEPLPAQRIEIHQQDDSEERERLHQSALKEWEQKITGVTRERDDLVHRIDESSKILSASQKQVDESARQLEQTSERVAKSEARVDELTSEFEALQSERLKLNQGLSETKRKIADSQERSQLQQTQYSFVPFDGKSGTTRRPILIECTDEAIRFIPEDVSLKPEDLNGFTVGYNPLLSGARALSYFWSLDGVGSQDDHTGEQPYVLLVVRPSGTVAFYMARKFLSRMRQPFGYELVEDDWELALPEPDPRAVKICRDAVTSVIGERNELHTMLREQRGFRAGNRGAGGGGSSFNSSRIENGNSQGMSPAARPFRLGNQYRSESQPPGGQLFPESASPPGQIGRLPRSTETENGLADALRSNGANPIGSIPGGVPTITPRDNRSGAGERTASATIEPKATGGGEVATTTNGGDKENSDSKAENRNTEGTQTIADKPSSEENQSEGSQVGLADSSSDSEGTLFSEQLSEQSDSQDSGESGNGAPQSGSSTRIELNRQGRSTPGWGFGNGRSGIGLERRVTVYIESYRVVVGDKILPADDSHFVSEHLADDAVFSAQQQVQSWGNAPRGFYWIPSIRFMVSPGGNKHYERLRPAFEQSGIPTSVKFRLEASQSAQKSRSLQ